MGHRSDNNARRRAPRISRARHAREWLADYVGAQQGPLALLLVGIKDLKQINERLGRERGDAVIRKVGGKISGFAGDKIADVALVARMPGREFLLIIGGEHATKLLESLARKLLDRLSDDLGEGDEPLYISARIGIACAEPNETGTELLHRAGTALSRAYTRKGKRMAFAEFHGTTDSQVTAAIDAGMRAAIVERQIAIVLQPQFEVGTGRLVGAEALARLHHKELGEVGAAQLFAAADRCDLREELSHLIQEEAIAIAARWPVALNNLRLAVNLGAEELGEGYCKRLLALLADTGFDADRLTLELTEESLVRDIDLASAELEQLRAKKIQIAVDDFGTGYSSLAYLKTLPLDYLKIDKGMTPDISGTGKDRIVLRAIIAMAKALELKIIAEGVEREEELAMLKAEGCDYFQGYLRSAPLSPTDFERFALRSN
ncbi:MAG: bifunctional diguanylate cyclase/phosphodiesterase [Sphingorhabdus sp.]